MVSEMGEMKKTADKVHRAVEESKRVLPAIGHQLTRVEQTKLTGKHRTDASKF